MARNEFKFGPFLGNDLIIQSLPNVKMKELLAPLNSAVEQAFINNFKEELKTTVDHAKKDKWTLNLDFIFDNIISTLFTTNDFHMSIAAIIFNKVKKSTGKAPIVVLGDKGWRIHFEAVYLNEKGDLVITDPTSAKANEYEFVGLL